MDGNIQKALWIGVSIMIFIVVLGIGMTALAKGKELSSESMKQLDSQTRMVSNTLYSAYDNSTLDGAMVVEAIKRFRTEDDNLVITVTTVSKGAKSYMNATDADIKGLQTKGSSTYINPYGEFYATLSYDGNEVITGIDFVQQ